jgi:acyl-CoA thioesterase I
VARFDQAVVAEKPDLVIWQVGTNALLHDTNMASVADTVRLGIDRLKEIGVDVIVIDPQFAPKVIAKPETERMVDSLSTSAKLENVNLFRRFAVKRYWNETNHVPFEQFVTPDGLHMNDWGYQCLAKLLAAAISDAATRIPQTAHVPTLGALTRRPRWGGRKRPPQPYRNLKARRPRRLSLRPHPMPPVDLRQRRRGARDRRRNVSDRP